MHGDKIRDLVPLKELIAVTILNVTCTRLWKWLQFWRLQNCKRLAYNNLLNCIKSKFNLSDILTLWSFQYIKQLWNDFLFNLSVLFFPLAKYSPSDTIPKSSVDSTKSISFLRSLLKISRPTNDAESPSTSFIHSVETKPTDVFFYQLLLPHICVLLLNRQYPPDQWNQYLNLRLMQTSIILTCYAGLWKNRWNHFSCRPMMNSYL